MAIKTTITSTGNLSKALEEMAKRAEEASGKQIELEVRCYHCGADDFTYDNEKGDEGHLWCNKCGTDIGTHREVVEKAALEKARQILRG